nr:hypothetical protein [Tanacetum cinerariifolium]
MDDLVALDSIVRFGFSDQRLEQIPQDMDGSWERIPNLTNLITPIKFNAWSVFSLKTFSRYSYTYLREIVLHRASYKEYKILKSDFKNLHPNDFEDLYLLHLQGKLNYLSGADKVHLFNTVNLWIRNIVIRQRVEDLQLGIESYQTKINLTQPMDCRVVPRNVNPVNVRNTTPARGECHKFGSTDHLKLACPRLNRAQRRRGNLPNQVVVNNEGQSCGNQRNQSRGKVFMLGAEEARQDLNIMTAIEPSELGFRYEIEIASGLLVEIDKVIKGYKLEIEGHVLIRIPLLDDKVLRVLGERPNEKARLLKSAKASDKKKEEIVMVRDFPKSPYHLASSELEELSGQLKELQDK